MTGLERMYADGRYNDLALKEVFLPCRGGHYRPPPPRANWSVTRRRLLEMLEPERNYSIRDVAVQLRRLRDSDYLDLEGARSNMNFLVDRGMVTRQLVGKRLMYRKVL